MPTTLVEVSDGCSAGVAVDVDFGVDDNRKASPTRTRATIRATAGTNLQLEAMDIFNLLIGISTRCQDPCLNSCV